VQLGNLLALPGGTAWIGITATTGQHTEAHDLLRWQFVANGAPEIVLATPALLPDGRARLRFNTQPGRRYLVQFSPDLAGWFDAGSAFTADEPISEWIDPGPPLTPTSPGITPQRFYRVRRQ
jgi:hypothetical protein